MKRTKLHLAIFTLFASVQGALLAQETMAEGGTPTPKSPAEIKITWARNILRDKPQNVAAHNALAMALARRARETGEPAFYDEALGSIRKSLELAPGNYEARRNRAWILLGQHEFAKALEEATALNKECPDDLLVYGFLTDAYVELGRYDEAEKACQYMLDLRPGTVPGLTRAAYLRELFGMIPGAIALMKESFDAIGNGEVEERAWVLTQIAHLELLRGGLDPAREAITSAFKLVPGYHYALAQDLECKSQAGELEAAVDAASLLVKSVPHPEHYLALGKALERAGRAELAKEAVEHFVTSAREESENTDNCNRDLIFHLAEDASTAKEALKIALSEFDKRKDIFTRHALAFALLKSGDAHRARTEIELALRPGYRDAQILYHAGLIASAEKDHDAARAYFEQSLAMNPRARTAHETRAALEAVNKAKR